MTPRPYRPRPTPASRPRGPRAQPAAPPPAAPGSTPSWTEALAPTPPPPAPNVDEQVASALVARVVARCKAVTLVTAPPGELIEAGTMLTSGRHGTMLLEPVMDGARVHELSARSPLTTGGGYVVIELAPVHGPACRINLAPPTPCDCGAQALFEGLILSGA